MASACALAFLQRGSWLPCCREQKPPGQLGATLEPAYYHFCHVLLVRAVTGSTPIQGDEEINPTA